MNLSEYRAWAKSKPGEFTIREVGEGVIHVTQNDQHPKSTFTLTYDTTLECYGYVYSMLYRQPPTPDDGCRGTDRRYW